MIPPCVACIVSVGDWLSQRLVIGIDKGFDTNRNLFPLEAGHLDINGNPQPVYSETVNGEMAYERSIITKKSFDYSVTADYDLNDNFSFGTSFGAQYYVDQFDGFFNEGSGFASPLSRTINQLAPDQINTEYAFDENKSLGFFIQEQVGYQDRLFVTGSLRFDDNSTFGVDAPTQQYPNAQATWVISEESFWGISALNSFRLRGAWGKAGRQPSSTSNQNIYDVIRGPGGQAGVRVVSPGNLEIEPEVSTEFEVGTDFALFEDRISGEFTHFWRKDENLLMGQSVLSSRGFPGGTQQNVGRLDSWGWEAQLSLALYRGNGISLDLDLAADYKNNEIKDIGTLNRYHWLGRPTPANGTGDLITSAQFDDAGDRRTTFGRAMSALCDSGVSLAPDDLTDPVEIDKYAVVPGGPPMPCGDIPNVNLALGPSFATHTFRIAPRLTLFDNTLQFTALAEGLYGAWESETAISASHFYNNTRVSRLENDPVWVYGNQIGDRTVRTVYENNFWKLREISARYTLPESIVGRTGAERASLAVSARNLYTLYRSQSRISGGKISDPEFGGGSWEMPPLASFSVTLRVTF